MAIDEIAEEVVERRASRRRATSRTTRRTAATSRSASRARSSSSTRSTAPARPRPASSRAACRSRSSRRGSTRRSATSWFGVVHEIKSGDRFFATRGQGARGRARRRFADPAAAVGEHRSRRAVLDGGVARPSGAAGVDRARAADRRSSMRGGYFDLGSATFNMTRIVTGQLDAYVDIGRRLVDELPELEAQFRAVGEGAVCTNFPVRRRGRRAHRAGGGRGRDPRRRRATRRAPGGRFRRRLRARGPGQRIAALHDAPARRSRGRAWSGSVTGSARTASASP